MKHDDTLQNCPHIELPIIGYVRSPFSQKFGIPRQPNLVHIPAMLQFIPPYDTPEAFEGIEKFSHIWLIWQFHHNKLQKNFRPKVRPPRLGGNDKLGVFATRSMYRPANMGISVVALQQVENCNGKTRLHISGADMVDGTPIIDIKPYLAYSDSISEARSGFADNVPVLKSVVVSTEFETVFYEFLTVDIENGTLKKDNPQITQIENSLSSKKTFRPNLTLQDFSIIQNLIAQDPRPAYRQAEIGTKFTLRYKDFDVGFFMNVQKHLVLEKIHKVDESLKAT